MSEYPTSPIHVKHQCGRVFLLSWIDCSTPEFYNIKAYRDQTIIAKPLTKCGCGKEIVPFRSKEWSEQ